MSEFRRFISYIYSYKGSSKLRNMGFAKMEARGEILRVQVHVKGVYGGNNEKCKVYGFFREDGFAKGILLGQFVIKNGMGDMAAVTDRNHVGNTDKCLEDLGGIYISVGEEKDSAMASEWDNIAVDTAFFKVYEKRTIEERDLLAEENKKKEAVREFLPEESVKEQSKSYIPEERAKKEAERSSMPEESVKEENKSLMSEEKAKKETEKYFSQEKSGENFIVQKNQTSNVMSSMEYSGNHTGTEQIETVGETANGGVPEEQHIECEERAEHDRTFESSAECGQISETEKNYEDVKSEEKAKDSTVLKEQAVFCGEVNVNVENFPENQERCEQQYSWKQLLKEYTIVHPFEECKNVEVIRIEPKDLGKLSKEYWVLGNNSFLLHGYCSYRYLILCKNKQEEKYFLGVPGVFHPREKVIAGMFGFSEFYMSRRGKVRHGEFGYYVREVGL